MSNLKIKPWKLVADVGGEEVTIVEVIELHNFWVVYITNEAKPEDNEGMVWALVKKGDITEAGWLNQKELLGKRVGRTVKDVREALAPPSWRWK